MPNSAALPGIAEVLSQFLRQSMALIEGAQGQKSGIAGDLPTGKISADELPTVEGESQLWYTLCQVMGAPKGNAGFSENPVFINLLEHPFFFGEKIQRIIQASGR